MTDDMVALLKEIADIEARLARIDEERKVVESHLQRLRAKIVVLKTEEPSDTKFQNLSHTGVTVIRPSFISNAVRLVFLSTASSTQMTGHLPAG